MAHATTNKQNRVLLITLTVLLAVAATLIAITGSANKQVAEQPPLDIPTETNAPQTTEDVGSFFGKPVETQAPVKETTAPETEAPKPTVAETEEVVSVAVEVGTEIPEMIVPVNGTVIKGHTVDVPVFSSTMNDYRTHIGVDIMCDVGTSVVAPADGTIGQVWEDPMMGVCLNVIHDGGVVSTFKGLAEETLSFISAGAKVKKGQAIAATGQTALIECGDEPHVHMELAVNGELVDPAEYMEFSYLADTFED